MEKYYLVPAEYLESNEPDLFEEGQEKALETLGASKVEVLHSTSHPSKEALVVISRDHFNELELNSEKWKAITKMF